ncbi:MAG: ABC transporter permease [Spirochaetes bacterium]|nr:MAG: ABC transporter permease [Spirochaetota bacterium]
MSTLTLIKNKDQFRRNLTLFILLLPGLLWILFLIVIPQLQMFLDSFKYRPIYHKKGLTLENYAYFFTNVLYIKIFLKTLLVAVLVTFVSFLVCFPIAFYIAKVAKPNVARKIFVLVIIPFWVSELIRTFSWMIILGDHGVINRFLMMLHLRTEPITLLYTNFSVIVGLVYNYLLFMILPIYSTLEGMDNSLMEAAQDLGANRFNVIRKIVIPYSIPGIMSGAIMVFMLSVGTYIAPTLLGGTKEIWFTELIYNKFFKAMNWRLGSALAFTLLILTILFIFAVIKIAGLKLTDVIEEE